MINKLVNQNCPIINRVTYYFLFQIHSLIFLNPYQFFKCFILILKNKRNFRNYGYFFVIRFHITLKNFPDD